MTPFTRSLMILEAATLLMIATIDPSATSRRVETRVENLALIERSDSYRRP